MNHNYCLQITIWFSCIILSSCQPTKISAPSLLSTPSPTTAPTIITPQTLSTISPAQTLPSDIAPTFKEDICLFVLPEGYQLTCGYLTVPENRSNPKSHFIRLAVAIFKSRSSNPAPDPVIHLTGGPGSSALQNAIYILGRGGDQILENRDYILFDQRGVNFSEPSLYCEPYDEYSWNAHEQNISFEEYNKGGLPFLKGCLDEWQSRGIDMSAYTSAESAADIYDLSSALGYEQVNLYGISYGSRLALTVMCDFPQIVRSAIIDAVFPPQANLDLDLALNANRDLQLVFADCAADSNCSRDYGDISSKFYAVIDRLESKPVTVEVTSPYREAPFSIYLDGDLFIDTIFVGLYSMGSIAEIPTWINAAYEERYTELSEEVSAAIGSPASTGMFYSITCREEIPFETDNQRLPESVDLPSQLSAHFSEQYTQDICKLWNIPAADAIENKAVMSDIPTLIFAGRYDPVTPPRYAESTAKTLSRHYYYLFPNQAHGVMRSDPCALQMGLEFLEDPSHEPDPTCWQNLSNNGSHSPAFTLQNNSN
jgi:pimeloyl-ACP methyl ester carboxylesterase